VCVKAPTVFFLVLEEPKQEGKKKGCYCGREKEIETNRHRIPAKEEDFVFVSFVISFENNLYCVIMRFWYIRILGLSNFLCAIFLFFIFHSEFFRDHLRQWTYFTLREPVMPRYLS
jgi:hypothetical protein